MKCIEVKEDLDAFLDGEIRFAEKKKIESHLEKCLSCQTELESLQSVGDSLRRNLFITAPVSLDEKVFSAFEDFHSQKQIVEIERKEEKTGWFGIPKFAFAAAFLLLALFSAFAFQIGRMSASNLEISIPEVSENQKSFDRNSPEIKIVEVPVVKEKIVEVPVIKEKIVTRTVYIEKKSNDSNFLTASTENNLALNSSIKDGEYLTTTNLEGFQPVAEIKAKITKKEEEK